MMKTERVSAGAKAMASACSLLAFWVFLMWLCKVFFGMMGVTGFFLIFLCIFVTVAFVISIVYAHNVATDDKTLTLQRYADEIRRLERELDEMKKKAQDNADDAALAREAARETIEAFRSNVK